MKTTAIVILLFSSILGFSCKEDHIDQPFDIIYVEGVILDSLTSDPLIEVEVTLYQGERVSFYPSIPVSDSHSNQYGEFKIHYVAESDNFRYYDLKFYKSGYYNRKDLRIEKGKKQNITIKLLKK